MPACAAVSRPRRAPLAPRAIAGRAPLRHARSECRDGARAIDTRPPADTSSRDLHSAPTLLDSGTASPTGASDADDDAALAPGSTFAGRYHVRRRLGVGGMGAVYHAWDTELGEDVAIKLIRPAILADPDVVAEVERRFKRELLLGRRVAHANVVRVHDLGTAGARKFITMSYVDGEDLATVLRRDGALPAERVARIGRAIAEALVAVHAAGIVHRDLKPSNVMLGRDDRVWLTDFGIARLMEGDVAAGGAGPEGFDATTSARTNAGSTGRIVAAATGGVPPAVAQRTGDAIGGTPAPSSRPRVAREGSVTQYGAQLGTPDYMAPEQLRGERVDARTDVYSLGLILHDLLTGGVERLASWARDPAAARAGRTVPRPSSIAQAVPAALDDLVARCIEPEPAKRPASAADVLAALMSHGAAAAPAARPTSRPRTYALVAGIVLLVVAGAVVLRDRIAPPAARPAARAADAGATAASPAAFDTVAVLPFASSGNAPDRQARGDAIAAEILTTLARSPELHVTGRSSSFQLRDAAEDPREVGRKLGVRYVVMGSIEPGDARLRAAARLVRTKDAAILWQATFDRPPDAVLTLQDEIARDVAGALRRSVPTRTAVQRIASVEARDLYVRATTTAWSAGTLEGYREAQGLLKRVTELSPQFARGYLNLSNAEQLVADYTHDAAALARARAAVDRAIELDPHEADAWGQRAALRLIDLDWAGARADIERAVSLTPLSANTYSNLAELSAAHGRIDDAIAAQERAVELDPLRPARWANLTYYRIAGGRLKEARESSDRGLALQPKRYFARWVRGLLELMDGRPAESLAQFAQVEDPGWQAFGVMLVKARYERPAFKRAFADFDREYGNVLIFQRAEILAWSGDADGAFAQMERALAYRQSGLPQFLKLSPLVAGLRGDPRYRTIVERAGLPTDAAPLVAPQVVSAPAAPR
jgi:serine/threonine protein kinase/TolB-like protein/Tfp pilus assembly protein PilF